MHAVITAHEAKQITRGRTPLVPVEYETAVKALIACTQIDDAKLWSDKADALAAWAKIYRSNETVLKAKQLKLHAYRRMGQLAAELRPTGPKTGNTGAGRLPGCISLLRENGLKKTEASACRRLALLSDRKFTSILKTPNAPSTIAWKLFSDNDPLWCDFAHKAMSFRTFCRKNSPASVAAIVRAKDKHYMTARDVTTEILEWVDELIDRLPKSNKGKAA